MTWRAFVLAQSATFGSCARRPLPWRPALSLAALLAASALPACSSERSPGDATGGMAGGGSAASGAGGAGSSGAGANQGGAMSGSAGLGGGGLGGSAGSAGSAARSVTVYNTSKSGEKLALAQAPALQPSALDASAPAVQVDVAAARQAIVGFGGSFTESAAAVLAKLSPAKRAEILAAYFSPEGANYSLTRTHIGSCDFSLGSYSYAETESNTLSDFSVAADEDDLLPLILDSQALSVDGFKIIASPWTSPPWMKTIGAWYQPPSAQNGYRGTGGKLKPEHRATFALYLSKYLSAYEAKGVSVWAITPENEPLGNSGQWESLEFSAAEMSSFISEHLGPRLASDHPKTLVLGFDQNRGEASAWANALLGQSTSAQFVSGTAVHWYASTIKVYEDVLDQIHAAYPDKILLNSEATIDALRDEAHEMSPPGDANVPWGKATGQLLYWKNDAWWWQKNASDWGYYWADGNAGTSPADQVEHPLYEPVYRYARDIIVGLNHWFVGWVDWNLVLDKLGGPNHVGNWAAAPIMVDTEAQEIYYTPLYYVMEHFSKFSRPGAHVVTTTLSPQLPLLAAATADDAGHVTLHVLNTTETPVSYSLVLQGMSTQLQIGAATLQTVVVQ